jgi:shikimate kinase/3-dehydroquinate synthase
MGKVTNKIALVGMMGSGKSEIGKKLAGILEYKFIDLDEEFEKENGSIAKFFRRYGENEFRKKEKTILKRTASLENVVISTGGGVVKDSENRNVLSDMLTFYLQCPVEILWKRAKKSDRPLAKDEEDFFTLFEEREPLYENFEKVQTEELNEWEVAAKITRKVMVPSPAKIFDAFQKVIVHDAFDFPLSDLVIVSNKVKKIWEINGVGIEDGESLKSIQGATRIWDTFVKYNLNRKSVVNVFGGGTTTDAVGFASTTFMRGMNFNLLPTTLLGMVDAAVGGKFAINFKGIKNSIGTFGRPKVFVNPIFALSLEDERFKEGIVEALKLGVVYDERLFEHVEKNMDKILKKEYESVKTLVLLAVKDKLEVVAKDPYDENFRHILNFGHTIGHAIESASENKVSHGHAVAIGMKFESRVFSPAIAQRLEKIIEKLNFSEVNFSSIKEWIGKDKKREADHIVIPIVDDVGSSHLEKVSVEDILLKL